MEAIDLFETSVVKYMTKRTAVKNITDYNDIHTLSLYT
jgi:hypothetical protein